MRKRSYDPDLRESIVRLHIDKSRTIVSLSKEYGISSSTISRWITVYKNKQSIKVLEPAEFSHYEPS